MNAGFYFTHKGASIRIPFYLLLIILSFVGFTAYVAGFAAIAGKVCSFVASPFK